MTDDGKARVPVAVLAAVVVQATAALLWAGGASARIASLEARVDQQGSVAERLARLEEQVVATRETVERIERRMEGQGG